MAVSWLINGGDPITTYDTWDEPPRTQPPRENWENKIPSRIAPGPVVQPIVFRAFSALGCFFSGYLKGPLFLKESGLIYGQLEGRIEHLQTSLHLGFNRKKHTRNMDLACMTGWWQLKDFWNFYPEPWGRWIQFDEHIFQMGWFNHQLVIYIYIWVVPWMVVPPKHSKICHVY